MKPLHSASGTGIGYNPGISYRGGELLGAGLAQAGNALAEGLQQFTKNREEADALNVAFESRAQPILQDLQRKAAKDGQLDPAVEAIVDKGAKWHSLGTSQKKQILADVVMLGDRRERQQREEMDNKWKALAAERDVQQLGLQRQQLGLERGRTGMEAMRTLLGAYNQAQDNTRADRQLALSEEAAAAQRAELERRRRAEAENVSALTGFARDFSGYAGEDFAPGAGRGMLQPMSDADRLKAALMRNPSAAAAPQFDNTLTALQRFAPKPSDGWGLKPGQPVPLPGGGLGFATTPNSIQGPPKVEAARFAQPELSKDGKFYRSGPDDNWHPVSQGNPLLEAILAQGGLRPGSLPVMPAAAAPKPTLKFNPKTGFVD